jgi:uncharacterized protein YqhQ
LGRTSKSRKRPVWHLYYLSGKVLPVAGKEPNEVTLEIALAAIEAKKYRIKKGQLKEEEPDSKSW